MNDTQYRVCFISSCFPPLFTGGVEKYLINLSKGLKEYAVESTILSRFYPPLPRKEQDIHYILFRIGANPFPLTTNHFINGLISSAADRFTYSFFGFFEALKIVRKMDIICPQLGNPWDVFLGVKLAEKVKKPCIVVSHGRFGYSNGDVKPTKKLKNSLRKASLIIANRQSAKNYILENDIAETVLIENPIPVQEFRRPIEFRKQYSKKIHVLFIGRLCARRGPDLAVDGFIKAAKLNSDIDLWIVGEGNLKALLIKKLKASGLVDRAIFFGKQFDVRKFLWAADIFLATSPIANFPSLSLREAMAAGLSIIATDVDETKSIVIPGETGCIVDCNATSISEAISALAINARLRFKLSNAAAIYAQNNLDLNIYCSKIFKLFNKIVSGADYCP